MLDGGKLRTGRSESVKWSYVTRGTESQLLVDDARDRMLQRFEELLFHDATAWIQQNWPDFDLESNHLVTWRGEQK